MQIGLNAVASVRRNIATFRSIQPEQMRTRLNRLTSAREKRTPAENQRGIGVKLADSTVAQVGD